MYLCFWGTGSIGERSCYLCSQIGKTYAKTELQVSRFFFGFALGCFSVAVVNALTKCNWERKEFTSPYRLSSVMKGSPGGSIEAGAEGGALEERLLACLICMACSACFLRDPSTSFPGDGATHSGLGRTLPH